MKYLAIIIICFICYVFSYQRPELSLDEIESTLHSYLTLQSKIEPIGFDLSDWIYIMLDNITVFYTSGSVLLNKIENTIDYFDMDIYVMFDMKIQNAPMKEHRDYFGAKNIIFTNRRNIANIFYSNFQFYQLNDKGFEFRDLQEPPIVNVHLRELNQYELYSDLMKDYGESKIKDLLLLKWYQTLNNILSIFPVCDALYYYNKLAEYLKAQGDISIKNQDYPSFTRLRFISITYKSILKINRFTERFTFVSFLIDFDNGASYQKEVYFEYIKITPISIEFGPFYPDDDIELQDVLTRYISESFDLILKSESN